MEVKSPSTLDIIPMKMRRCVETGTFKSHFACSHYVLVSQYPSQKALGTARHLTAVPVIEYPPGTEQQGVRELLP